MLQQRLEFAFYSRYNCSPNLFIIGGWLYLMIRCTYWQSCDTCCQHAWT